MKEGKRKEGEEMKASGPTASPVLAPPPQKKIGSRTATAIQTNKITIGNERAMNNDV
jgi:hypothetical protein